MPKGRGTRDQIANIRWIMENAREFQKNIYFYFIDYAKAFVRVNIWKLLGGAGEGTYMSNGKWSTDEQLSLRGD